LKIKAPEPFETSAATNRATQRHVRNINTALRTCNFALNVSVSLLYPTRRKLIRTEPMGFRSHMVTQDYAVQP